MFILMIQSNYCIQTATTHYHILVKYSKNLKTISMTVGTVPKSHWLVVETSAK